MIPDKSQVLENEEISINYVLTGKGWNRNEIDVDENFVYTITCGIIIEDEDLEPKSVK